MASHYYIKLFHEILDDSKMGRLRDNLWRRSIECFLMAGELQNGGKLPEFEDMAWRLHITPELLEAELLDLVRVGILVHLEDNGYIVKNWNKWQDAMTDAERMRRMREGKRKRQYYGDDTPSERDSYEPVTKANAEVEIEEEIEEEVHTHARANGQPEKQPTQQPPMHAGMRFDADGDKILMIQTAIVNAVKTKLIIKTQPEFFSISEALFFDKVTPADVDGFGAWWKEHGHYPGKPALTSLANEFDNYTASKNSSASDDMDAILAKEMVIFDAPKD